MSDEGKNAAIEVLRREVGFGCPICRSPFLTWHHFDPPWHVEHHWRPEGMIALCWDCHADADEKPYGGGKYSKAELRARKSSSHSLEDVKARFPAWERKQALLVRVGGCYADTSGSVISINGIPQIGLGRSETALLQLSFDLRNENDDVLVSMKDNWLTAYPAHVHNMKITPRRKEVVVWLRNEDVGLESLGARQN